VFTLWMLAHYFKRDGLNYIGYEGKGKQVRDLLHVDDVFSLVDIELGMMEQVNAKIYNVGGGNAVSLSLQETTELCRGITGNTIRIGSTAATRPADLILYITDTAKVRLETGWAPRRSCKDILGDIFQWIRLHEKELKALL